MFKTMWSQDRHHTDLGMALQTDDGPECDCNKMPEAALARRPIREPRLHINSFITHRAERPTPAK